MSSRLPYSVLSGATGRALFGAELSLASVIAGVVRLVVAVVLIVAARRMRGAAGDRPALAGSLEDQRP